ncbi:hypothetical protein HanHA300_Chr10g0376121 [Helianthus annuus]|nr:hypothetical protein HanHA300_Chr10g0376121 [Helianthus annuus]
MPTASLIIHYRTMIFTNLYVGVSTPVHHPSSYRYGGICGDTRRSSPLTIRCCSSSDSNSGRGFGPAEASIAKDGGKSAASRRRKSVPQQPGSIPNQAPATNYGMDGTSKSFTSDLEFEEKLQAVKRYFLRSTKYQPWLSMLQFLEIFFLKKVFCVNIWFHHTFYCLIRVYLNAEHAHFCIMHSFHVKSPLKIKV